MKHTLIYIYFVYLHRRLEMRISKRKEPFRFIFTEPIAATFEIIQIGDRQVSSSRSDAIVKDLSPQGMKLNTSLKMPQAHFYSVQLSIEFTLNSKPLTAQGMIVWMKNLGKTYDYGISLFEHKERERDIIEQLKQYSRKKGSYD